jgi:hypothetical protein
MKEKPESLNILGVPYKVIYCEHHTDVDVFKRESLSGSIDHWTKTIRIHDNERPIEDKWETILHEVLHGIAAELHLEFLSKCSDDELDLLALALNDFLFRNDLIKLENREADGKVR